MFLRLGILFLLTATAVADIGAILQAMDAINANLRNLDAAVLNVTQGSIADLVRFGALAVPLLENATRVVQQSAPLSLQDAAALGPSTAALRQNANLTISDFIAQKPYFDATNGTSPVLQATMADKVASIAFGEALASKIPDLSSLPDGGVDVTLAFQELTAIFDRGIAAFSSTGTGVINTGIGTLDADGTCSCAVQCPAGSLDTSPLMMRHL
ncbi:hypothetical protein N0V82_001069 [Gnomoniopsis sp. IMI 355080]|nr:hypothetical protein N0V82_001069 [Gnomoniopsis sp. IMI 355080]